MKNIITNKRGETHINTAVKIILAVVIGGLILGGLYLVFAGDGGVMDNLNSEVEGMMDYEQELRYEKYYDEDRGIYTIRYSYDGKHWETPTMPDYGETATVYSVISNDLESDPVEAAMIQDGNQYYIITSTDGGVTWTEQLAFTATQITHFYYGTCEAMPSTSTVRSFQGKKFACRYKNGSYFSFTSLGHTWVLPTWSDFILPN